MGGWCDTVFMSLIVAGEKLFLNMDFMVLKHLYLPPDCNSEMRVWQGWYKYFDDRGCFFSEAVPPVDFFIGGKVNICDRLGIVSHFLQSTLFLVESYANPILFSPRSFQNLPEFRVAHEDHTSTFFGWGGVGKLECLEKSHVFTGRKTHTHTHPPSP